MKKFIVECPKCSGEMLRNITFEELMCMRCGHWEEKA